jgi:hypothetical protein
MTGVKGSTDILENTTFPPGGGISADAIQGEKYEKIM